MKIKLSDFRETRRLARAYRAGLARQEVSPQAWREDGLDALTKELVRAMEYWHTAGKIYVYERAVNPAWDTFIREA